MNWIKQVRRYRNHQWECTNA